MNIKQQLITLIGTGLLTIGSAAHAADTQWFSPYPGSPLSLQPKPANQVPPNVLLFIDNAYDAGRGLKDNFLPEFVFDDKKRKIYAASKVVKKIAPLYPHYRWGLATYQGFEWSATPSHNFLQSDLCSSESRIGVIGYKNWKQENCAPYQPVGSAGLPDINNRLAPPKRPYHSDVGAIIAQAINSESSAKNLASLVDMDTKPIKIPYYKIASPLTPYASPIASAYHEMTRYYRGMPSAYDKHTQLGSRTNGWLDARAFTTANNYQSPIEFRCQQNNIILLSSAGDIRTSHSYRLKTPFYEAYTNDPLYKHDNLDLAKKFGVPDSMNPVEATATKPFYLWLARDAGIPEGGHGRIKTQPNSLNYNAQFQTPHRFPSKANYFVRQEYGQSFSIYRDGRPGLIKENKTPIATAKRVYNPYFDVMKKMGDLLGEEGYVVDGKFYLQESATTFYPTPIDYNTSHKNKYKIAWREQPVIVRNNYNEADGLPSFAHLAYDADIIPGKEFEGANDLCTQARADEINKNISDPDLKVTYNPRYDRDCKPWDGSGDNAIAIGGSGQTVDYSHRFKKQNIRTFGIGYAAFRKAKREEFYKYNQYEQDNPQPPRIPNGIKKGDYKGARFVGKVIWRVAGRDVDHYPDRIYLHNDDVYWNYKGASKEFDKELGSGEGWDVVGLPAGYKISKNFYVYVERGGQLVPVLYKDYRPAKVKSLGIESLSTMTPKGCGAPCAVSTEKAGKIHHGFVTLGTDYEAIPGDSKSKVDMPSSPVYPKYRIDVAGNLADGMVIQPGERLFFIHPDVAFAPSNDAQELLKGAGELGGGAYFYSASGSDEELERYLKAVLDQIGAAVTSTPIGGTIATNNTSLAELKETIATTLNTDRWTSKLQFYKNIGMEIDYNKPKVPAYTDVNSKPLATTLISSKDGVRRLNEKEEDNGITFSNDTFGIGAKYINPAKGKTLIVSSKENDEWKSLAKWLTRSTPRDCVDDFKRTKTLSTGAVWTDLVYRNRNPNDPACTGNDKVKGDPQGRYMGDVLEGNLVLAGNEHKQADERTPRPLLMMGANDGMLHILKTNEKANKETHPYEATLNYIPGTIKRSLKGEAVLTDGTVVGEDIIRNLVYTAEPSYGLAANAHQYFVNGKIRYAMLDNDDKGKPHMLITSTLGQGGRGAFSLNLGGIEYKGTEEIGLDADKSTWHTKVPVWETSSNAKFGAAQAVDDASLGFITGAASVGRIAMKNTFALTGKDYTVAESISKEPGDIRYTTFLSSGFDAPDEKQRKLYILDQLGVNVNPNAGVGAKTNPGAIIKTISLSSPQYSGGNIKSGLAAPALVDLNRDGIADLAYAGDQQGDMWRFDLRGDSSEWKATKILDGSPQRPITAEPTIFNQYGSKEVIVLFGTGSDLYQSDMVVPPAKYKTEQRLYGIVDKVVDCDQSCQGQYPIKEGSSALLKQSFTYQGDEIVTYTDRQKEEVGKDPEEVRFVSVNQCPNKESSCSWYIELRNMTNIAQGQPGKMEGERVLTQPLVLTDRLLNNGMVMFLTEVFGDNADGSYGSNPTCTAEPIAITKRIVGVDVKTGANPSTNTTGRVNLSRTAKGTLSGTGIPSNTTSTDADASNPSIGGIAVDSKTNSLVMLKQSVSAITPTGLHSDGKFGKLQETPNPELPDCWQDWYTPGLGGSINICPTTLLRVNIREVDLY